MLGAMSSGQSPCALCGRTRELTSRYGLEICGECDAGNFDAGLAEPWGATLTVQDQQEIDPKHYESALLHRLSVDVNLSAPSPCAMRLVPEHGGHKLVKLFKNELQVGDKAFDDAVYIADEHREATREFLGKPGVREAVLVLLREELARLELRPGVVHYQARHRGTFDPAAEGLLTALVCIAKHLEQMAVV